MWLVQIEIAVNAKYIPNLEDLVLKNVKGLINNFYIGYMLK